MKLVQACGFHPCRGPVKHVEACLRVKKIESEVFTTVGVL